MVITLFAPMVSGLIMELARGHFMGVFVAGDGYYTQVHVAGELCLMFHVSRVWRL
jgi:hypothetical protein